MLRLITAITLCLGASSAFAEPLDTFKATNNTRSSFLEIGCRACVDAEELKQKKEAVSLAPGEQIVELRDVDGEKKIYRTEAWLGGSPVTMVSKASELGMTALGFDKQEIELALGTPSTEDEAVQSDVQVADAAADAVNEPAVTEPVLAEAQPVELQPSEPVMASAADEIDLENTTASLTANQTPSFDPQKMELRLN